MRPSFSFSFSFASFGVAIVSLVACGSHLDAESQDSSEATVLRGTATSTSCTADSQCPAGMTCERTREGEFERGTCHATRPEPSSSLGGGTASATPAAIDSGANVVVMASDPDAGAADARADASSSPIVVVDAGADATVTPPEPTCGAPLFGPELADAPGGQRAWGKDGSLYYTTYGGNGHVLRVPPGGGTREVLLSSSTLGWYGALGAPFFENDHSVLITTRNGLQSLDPTTKALTTVAPLSTNGYAWGVLRDATGRTIAHAASPGGVLAAGYGSQTNVGIYGSYTLVRGQWAYRAMNGTPGRVERVCADGTERFAKTLASTPDAYGLAFGKNGKLYTGQGNTNPSKVFEVPIEGGVAREIATLPIAITFVTSDAAGYVYVAGWGVGSGGAGDTMWRIDPVTKTTRVYACDPSANYPCD